MTQIKQLLLLKVTVEHIPKIMQLSKINKQPKIIQ